MSDKQMAAAAASFNARNSSPIKVAGSFVFTSHFEKLAGDWNAILIGPRGSGKTTLLKMLQIGALRSWSGMEADKVRQTIESIGVYVPADSAWSTYLDSMAREEVDPLCSEMLVEAALTNHILQAFVRALDERRTRDPRLVSPDFLHVGIGEDEEARIVRSLARAWSVAPVLPTIRALREALSERNCLISSLSGKGDSGADSDKRNQIGERFPFLRFGLMNSLSAGVEVVNGVLGEEYRKWAILFDELEILPDNIQSKILQLLRSTDQRFIFKIAISPHTAQWEKVLQGEAAPQALQDYVSIPLWYTDRKRMMEFSERLLERQVAAAGLDVTSAQELLGSSDVFGPDDDAKSRTASYRQNGKIANAFVELSKSDAEFRNFLRGKGIRVDSLDASDQSINGTLIRKIAPLVVWRHFFQKSGEGSAPAGRSRKMLPYWGKESLVAVTEGNPRWIMALAKALIDAAATTEVRPLPDKIQSDEVVTINNRFAAMLRTAPVGDIAGLPPKTTLLDVLDAIGESLKVKTVTGPFKSDPVFTWTFDDARPAWEEEMHKLALNLGGIVYLPEGDDPDSLSSLRRRRFRLSFTLAPKYYLPIRTTRQIKLTSLLEVNSGNNDLFGIDESEDSL